MESKIINNNNLKSMYLDIEIPEELNFVINEAIKKGKRKNFSTKYVKNLSRVAIIFIIALTSFTAAINISPSFANKMSNIPVIGNLVKILIFVDGKASGGTITDGSDLENLQAYTSDSTDTIVLRLDGENSSPYYEINASSNPDTLQIDMAGVRRFSATEDFEKLLKLDSVNRVYRLMTLDDSLVRFNIVFNYPVDINIQEFSDPASLKIDITKREDDFYKNSEIYSLRSESYQFSENFGHIEESLYSIDNDLLTKKYRILTDLNGDYLIELATFDSEKSANEYYESLKNFLEFKITIEKRKAFDIPIPIK